MNAITKVVFSSGLLLLSGCAEERVSPEGETTEWTVPAADGSVAKGDSPSVGTEAGSVAQAQAGPVILATVPGSAFSIDGTTVTAQSDDSMRMAHYFSAEAQFELPTTATVMETEIEGITTSEGGSPIVAMSVFSVTGKYQEFRFEPRPVSGVQTLQETVSLRPETYKVKIDYFKDTGNGARPALVLKKIVFKDVSEDSK